MRRLYSLRIERDLFGTARLLGRSWWRSSRPRPRRCWRLSPRRSGGATRVCEEPRSCIKTTQAVEFAQLSKNLKMTNKDFYIV